MILLENSVTNFMLCLFSEIRWTKLYQKLPRTSGRNPKEHKKQLMVRPQFPTVYLENKMPDVSSISEEVVVINDWKIGDLVDWWVDGCYWSGWLKFDDQKYKVILFAFFFLNK